MSVIDLRRRMDRIEAGRRTSAPTAILSDRPPAADGSDEADAALANWRMLVAQGRAGLSGDALCLLSPEMSEVDWAARYVTEH